MSHDFKNGDFNKTLVILLQILVIVLCFVTTMTGTRQNASVQNYINVVGFNSEGTDYVLLF